MLLSSCQIIDPNQVDALVDPNTSASLQQDEKDELEDARPTLPLLMCSSHTNCENAVGPVDLEDKHITVSYTSTWY